MIGWDEEVKKSLGYCGSEVKIGFNTIFTNPKAVFLGDRVRIDPFCLITAGLKTGSNVQICSHTVFGGGDQQTITMGDWSFAGYGSQLFCGSESYDGDHGPINDYWGGNKVFRGDIRFNDHSGVASSVIVMPGVELPIGCCIGAMSFVYKSTELKAWSVYIGNPLRFHKDRNQLAILEKAKDPAFLKDRS